jgi:hypothetical protein
VVAPFADYIIELAVAIADLGRLRRQFAVTKHFAQQALPVHA